MNFSIFDAMNHELCMKRCIELAQLGLGAVSPNPMVGSVLVYDGRIIAEGYHEKCGEGHAEVNCLKDFDIGQVEEPSKLVLYVSLEPCSHFGKTPPCAHLIIEKRIPKVVIGSGDPNPKVNGNGVRLLKEKGIEVIEGVLKQECDQLNKRFFKIQKKGLPYIILKWAETKDGFVARKDYTSKWISGELSRIYVHKWRAEEDAIMVGKNTVIYDNPSLTVRDYEGKDPIRITFDRKGDLAIKSQLFDGKVQTYVLSERKREVGDNVEYLTLMDTNNLEVVLKKILSLGIQSIFIEGGSTLIHSFIAQGLWDEARVFVGKNEFVEGIKAPKIDSFARNESMMIENDSLTIYYK